MATVKELLLQNPICSSLPPLHLDQVAARLTKQECAVGAEIVRQGEPGDALYLIESGAVGVFRRDPKLGIVQLMARLEAPEAFGELSLLTREPRIATCTALEPTVVWRLESRVFLALVQQVPAVSLGVARIVAERLAKTMADLEIPWWSLAGRTLDRKLWALAPETLFLHGQMVPLELDGRTLTVGMVDPSDAGSFNALRTMIPGMRFRVVAVGSEEFDRFVEPMRSTPKALPRVEPAARAEPGGRSVSMPPEARPKLQFVEDDDSRSALSGSRATPVALSGTLVVSLVDEIVSTALASRASDIHIEHERSAITVRYRVEGDLRKREQALSPEFGKPLVNRLKLLAKLDITDTRRPQDGRITVQVDKRLIDLRISTIPAKFGEKVVLRVLDAEGNVSDLKTLILQDKVRQFFSEMIFRPNGLVLVTGPTGSGKTTTLYTALSARRRPELNVVTVEDPIEYHLDGVTQIQVEHAVGLTFAVALRSLLRQDPNVILVGETRDRETARMAIEAAMTGHLVMTSLHTNGALESVVRLLDIDVERNSLANALLGVLHQRLVRRICADCAEPFEYPGPILERLYKVGAFLPNEKPQLKHGRGCGRCAGTGFKGRVGLFELLIVNDAVRSAIASGAELVRLREVARAGALVELARYAGLLLGGGITVPGEVLHLLQTVGA